MCFIKFGKFWAITSSNIFFCPFLSFLLCIRILHVWWCPSDPSGSSIFPSFFFLFLKLGDFNCLIFKFADSSVYSNLLLNASWDFFFFNINHWLFSFRISIWLLFHHFFLLYITYLFRHCSCDILYFFVHSFLYLVKTVDLKSSTSNFNVWASSG